MTDETWTAQIEREYTRLGLDKFDSPYGNMAGTDEGLAQFVAMLRGLEPGVTWRDIHPEMPAHWISGDPDSYTEPFVPYGSWDYQELPAGPAVMVAYRDAGAGARFNALVERARAAGFTLYGAGIKYRRGSTDESNWGIIVLPRGTTDDAVYALVEWARAEADVVVARPDRREDDVYYVPEQ